MCGFVGVDPSLGRLDYSLLPDQALVEILIEGFDDEAKKQYQDNHGMFLDACEWPGIKCDEDERVIEIKMDNPDVSGSLELCYVPPKVKFLERTSWARSKLTGSADLTKLPLKNNNFTGEIDLIQLPDGIDYLSLSDNHLTGGIDLTQLPHGIYELHIGNNRLTGEIFLAQLLHGMRGLYLGNNQLTGIIDLTQLPDGLNELHLPNNQLTEGIDLTQLPDGMNELHLPNNQLSGSVVIKRLPLRIRYINVYTHGEAILMLTQWFTREYMPLSSSQEVA